MDYTPWNLHNRRRDNAWRNLYQKVQKYRWRGRDWKRVKQDCGMILYFDPGECSDTSLGPIRKIPLCQLTFDSTSEYNDHLSENIHNDKVKSISSTRE